MGKRNRRGKRKITSLNELYELEYVKKEKKKKLKQLSSFKVKKSEEPGVDENKKGDENGKQINHLILEEYKKLKELEEPTRKNGKGKEDGEERKNKSAHTTFLQILKKKEQQERGTNGDTNKHVKKKRLDGRPTLAGTSEGITSNEEENRGNSPNKEDSKKGISNPQNRESKINVTKNVDDLYMSFLITSVKNQRRQHIGRQSSFKWESHQCKHITTEGRRPTDECSLKRNEAHSEEASEGIQPHPNYCYTYKAKCIFENYVNESYKLQENKMDYFFTFCQNVDEKFLQKFCAKKVSKMGKTDGAERARKNETIEEAYVTSNLFLETNIFSGSKGERHTGEHTNDHTDSQTENHHNNDADNNTDNHVDPEGELFRDVQVKPHFFSSYREKNHVSYYLLNILDTIPKCFLHKDNPYNVYEPIVQGAQNYLSAFEPPLAYFNRNVYRYLMEYYTNDFNQLGAQETGENYDNEGDNHIIEECPYASPLDDEKTSGRLEKDKEKKLNVLHLMHHDELKSYFHYINSYVDILYSNQNILNSHFIRLLNTIHVLTHLKKKRKRKKYIKKKIEKLEKKQQVEKDNVQLKEDLCDESFARPKILILCGFRHIAKEYTDLIMHMLTPTEVKNKNRFIDEYDVTSEEKKGIRDVFIKKRKPIDYINLYRGNNDDCFRLGIKLLDDEKKIQLYSPFYESDILITSPLGLEVIIKESHGEAEEKNGVESDDSSDQDGWGHEEKDTTQRGKRSSRTKQGNRNKRKNEKKKKKLYEYDFLSSIEILIIDQADIILMQNILTLKNVLNFVNKPLLRWGSANINRIPKYVINGYMKNYRQTIITSSILDTTFISLIQAATNYRGFLKLFMKGGDQEGGGNRHLADEKHGRQIDGGNGKILNVDDSNHLCKTILLSVRNHFHTNQYFRKIECPHILQIEENIIEFFATNVIDILTNIKQLLIFLPTYIEYLRIYEILKKKEISFKGVNEYTNEKKIGKIQKLFKLGRINILLVTGRLFFYERCTFRGANHVIFFSPPKFPFMYYEMIKNLVPSSNSSSICYYTKYHTYELERIVGKKLAIQLMQEKPGKITLFK
ncbi:conserved protein, unknown function [Plasmodium knowlesi strain H]|uniref:U3 small nucleolar RNA-associated protein 25 n=3 Tax=Plasmodium knowlesi TaxID=5850 RepID=A0A5K1VU99_PLAKH|nr:uncharacterized protein PKNH_0803800 [Plasmodium knowlesi strain H]OTN65941.1 Uncharacterized protein PKNOH_S100031600 [Plasmodium knowlesi]CAA9987681.1 U3 small nucleolar RNA-associated protein 25, putative [Plasmodium knowlesi strain H]SBO26898.1 conserved protein, unknown function [Plasmodium knowlesi strain H]SBO29641.1 conserved protein, unknown function [Plasmodium knowlesi strain H]VVS77155.1 U3 small nucleolar RNA-associated protein 25, putative [Plasmodium knowlesi strain H]|eukprot:XP_002258679.1 [Plasmodium knowlesi strain H]